MLCVHVGGWGDGGVFQCEIVYGLNPSFTRYGIVRMVREMCHR